MSQPFTTSPASNQLGLGSPRGAGNALSGDSAQDGLFSTLVSLVNGNGDAANPSNNIQAGSADYTGESWLNLQMGDISLSLNSQAIANALPPQSMHEIIPDILNDLNLDQAILDGMRKLGEAAQLSSAAQSAQGQTASIKSGANANEQTLLALLAQNNTTQTNTAQNAATPGALPFVATSLSEQPDNPLTPQQVLLAQETTAKTVLANTLSSNSRLSNDSAISQNTLLANAQVAESATDTLAAQLQRQLAIRGDAKQSANMQASDHGTKANTQTHAQAMSLGPNMATAAASVSQLPIVQTREVITSSDPLLVAQNLGHASTQAAQTALFKPVQAAYHSPQVNIPNVAMEITRHVSAGNNQFQIRLDPAELGRIDVRLHMDDGGNTHARLVVERPETLAMLQRDAHSLERALTQAGLEASKTNLEFSLKQNPFAGGQFASNDDSNASGQQNSEDEQNQIHSPPDMAIAAYQGSVRPGGISLWV